MGSGIGGLGADRGSLKQKLRNTILHLDVISLKLKTTTIVFRYNVQSVISYIAILLNNLMVTVYRYL